MDLPAHAFRLLLRVGSLVGDVDLADEVLDR